MGVIAPRYLAVAVLSALLPLQASGMALAPAEDISSIIAHYETGQSQTVKVDTERDETPKTLEEKHSAEEAHNMVEPNGAVADAQPASPKPLESQNTVKSLTNSKAFPDSEQTLYAQPLAGASSVLSKYTAVAMAQKKAEKQAEKKAAEVASRTSSVKTNTEAKPSPNKKTVAVKPIVKPLSVNITRKNEPREFPSPLAKQRYHYDNARDALDKEDQGSFAYHYAQLGDYPLVPYLDYVNLKRDIYDFDLAKIDVFLEEHDKSFLGYRLREQLLYALYNRGRWQDYLSYYREDMGQRPLQCYEIYARYKKGDKDALNDVANIWTQGKSQPKACDRLFSVWRQKGGLTDDVAWTRFNNAMANRKTSLARYITRYMSAETKTYADKYLGVHGYPGRIKNHRNYAVDKAENALKMQQIISHGIKRYARIDSKDALRHWERYEASQLFPKELAVETKLELLKRLSIKGHTEEAEALIQQSTDIRNNDVVERLIREALRQEQYAKVLKWIDYLDEDAQQSNRWLYWRARAQDELQLNESLISEASLTEVPVASESASARKTSREIYEQLSKERSFYGFMSADILNRKYNLEDRPSFVANHTEHVVKNMPAIRRAYELWVRGSQSEFRAEWQFATKYMSQEQLAAAGRVAREWGWYNKGIHAMIRGNYWDDLDIRFPLAYRDAVENESLQTNVDTTFIYAIARQESAFHERARSSAGAMGLMQLMPYTARQTAKRSGIKHRDSYLLDPEYNIKLGSRYLKEQLDKFNGNRILAAAAYNAGPHRVDSWIKKNSLSLPYDVWIESIPFRETRGYVQNVLAFSVIYAYRLGQESELVTVNEINHKL